MNTSIRIRMPRARSIAALLAVGVAGPLFGQSAPPDAEARSDVTAAHRGRQIAETADRRDLGWGDNASTMRMVLKNRNGDESSRTLRREALENNTEGQGDLSLIVFESPRDVAGTSLLTHSRILEPDEQWLFLPALKRVKRISSANKSGPFVGSEFAYEDLASQEVDKFTYEFLREERCGALECVVVQRVPRYENSGYARQIVWWDTDHFRLQKIEYYDRKDSLLKTLTYHGYAEYAGSYWRPDRMSMVNHQNGKSTDLFFERWTFGNGLTADELTPSRLRRVR